MNEPNEALTVGTSSVGTILSVFIVAFFAVSVIALVLSLIRGKDPTLAKSCRSASWMAFFVGLIILYLRFVLT